jgi:hypothetical protein
MRVALIVLIALMSLNALSDLAVLIFAKIIDDDDDRRYWAASNFCLSAALIAFYAEKLSIF